ncbi:MAG: diguanylate cyclase [Planctomycetes bacterium]|nr:diguanylate cyclase [Planctomycetota bacterium]
MVEQPIANVTSATPASSLSRFGRIVRSLQFKATLLVVALTLCVTAAVSGYLVRFGVKLIERQHYEQLAQSTAMLARAAAEPCARGDEAALQGLATEAADGLPLLYVVITAPDGTELAMAEHRGSHLLQDVRERHWGEQPVLGAPRVHETPEGTYLYLDVAYPIRTRVDAGTESGSGDTKLLGYVRAGMPVNRWRQTMSSKLDLVVGVGIVATAVAIMLGFVLIRRIVSPLEGLAGTMQTFSRGDFNVRSRFSRRDEIGELAIAFNRMADQQQQTHERIVQMNTELEERVAERTRQLRELAARDPLTRLYNRRHFSEALDQSFSGARRYDNDLAFIMIDLDDFKAVNDEHGHQIGDHVLKLVADTIARQLRTPDVAARYGGDEFVMFLPQTDADSARSLAARIVERFARDLAAELPAVRVTLSAGIASLQAVQAADVDSLIRCADRAMYEAKEAGKNRIVIATTLADATPR